MPGPRYVKEFEFPSSAGFTGSATDRTTTSVRSHERSKPRFAEGGPVTSDKTPPPNPPTSQKQQTASPPPPKKEEKLSLAEIMGGKGRRQAEKDLGLKKGGRAKRKFAEGGSAGVNRSRPSSDLDEELGGRSTLRPGYRKGGLSPKMVKKAMGGPVKAAKGGDVAQDRKMIHEALEKHINSPAPRGHKGLKGCAKGGFQRTPMYGK